MCGQDDDVEDVYEDDTCPEDGQIVMDDIGQGSAVLPATINSSVLGLTLSANGFRRRNRDIGPEAVF